MSEDAAKEWLTKMENIASSSTTLKKSEAIWGAFQPAREPVWRTLGKAKSEKPLIESVGFKSSYCRVPTSRYCLIPSDSND